MDKDEERLRVDRQLIRFEVADAGRRLRLEEFFSGGFRPRAKRKLKHKIQGEVLWGH